jgi:hypothetical protein
MMPTSCFSLALVTLRAKVVWPVAKHLYFSVSVVGASVLMIVSATNWQLHICINYPIPHH